MCLLFQKEKPERGLLFQSDETQDNPAKETNDVEMSSEDQDPVRKEWQDTTSSVFMGNNPSFADEQVNLLYFSVFQ